MKIGIDIDDTIVKTGEFMIKYADKYSNEVLGINKKIGSLGYITNSHYLSDLYDWDNETKFDFFNKYYKSILQECVILPYVKETINKLKSQGHQIFFITARLIGINGCDTETITKNTLEGIFYDDLILGASKKLKFCKELGIDVFIEDSYETCQVLQENGIKSYLMTTKLNEKVDTKDICRVKDWKHIYDEVNKM